MECLVGWIGGAAIALVSVRMLTVAMPWLFVNLIGPLMIGSKIKLKSMGDWALITGATEGIGKAYAKALAKQGLNVILVSRSQQKLNDVASEIETKYKVNTKVIVIDFTSDSEIYDLIAKSIFGLEIGVLVNNVGISYANPEYFLALENAEKFMNDIVRCNILSVTNMCRIVMPGMIERKRGVIINISSMAAKIPNPLLTVYSATKAFVDKFSEDLSTEYSSKGIIVQSVLPGFVVSNMTRIRRPTWITPSADQYVSAALNTIGYTRHTTGYYPHAFMKLVIDTMHTLIPETANKIILRQMENIRARSLRKKPTNVVSE